MGREASRRAWPVHSGASDRGDSSSDWNPGIGAPLRWSTTGDSRVPMGCGVARGSVQRRTGYGLDCGICQDAPHWEGARSSARQRGPSWRPPLLGGGPEPMVRELFSVGVAVPGKPAKADSW